ncbi:MAG: ATP-binding cassette domain-containing protein [Coprobacillus sp.]
MLELKNIRKVIKERVILDDISITFNDTGFVGIVGESGCGKSTLLYIIGMLDQNFAGEVIYNGNRVDDHVAFIQSSISYMMQSKDYISSLTVKENIVLACQSSQIAYNQNDFKKITQQLGIYNLLQRYPHQLSGGQLKRVSIAKALLKQSPILLCDEPTGALHDKQAQEVMELLQKVSKKRLVIIVSHDVDLIKQYCDHVLTLKDTHLKGKIKKIKQRETFVQKKTYYSLFFYSLRQLIYQKGKIVFLFIFQWIVIVAFFMIVTGIQGVFEAIDKGERQAPLKNMIMIEKKDGHVFDKQISQSDILTSMYSYHLEQITMKSNQQDVSALLKFLPSQTSHIVLTQGRLPQNSHEIIVSESVYKSLKDNTKISFHIQNTYRDMDVVGVIVNDFFSSQDVYCLSSFKNNISTLINTYSLSIEINDNQSRELYKELEKNYFVSSEVIERSDSYQSVLSLASIVAGLFIGISFVISLLLIAIVESTIYFERKHDIAYLLSLGLFKRRLFFLSFIEALVLGVVIAIGGSLLSMLVYYYVHYVYKIEDIYHVTLQLKTIFFNQYDIFIVIVLSYIVMCMLGIMVPLKKMMNTDMIDVLREE